MFYNLRENGEIVAVVIILLIIVLLFISTVITLCDKKGFVKRLDSINNLNKSDFIIETNDVVVKRYINTLIADEKSFRGLSGEKYYHIGLNVTASKEGYAYIKDGFHKENLVVSYEDYKAFKDLIKGFDCLELDACELLISLKDDARIKCGFANDKKYHTLRVNIPYICSNEPFADEDIDDIIMAIKEELIIGVRSEMKKSLERNKIWI